MSGQGNLIANGVMIFNAPQSSSDNIDIGGSGTVIMTPPTTGLYQGMLLFQDRTATNTIKVTGNGNFNVTGTFYAANALVKVAGNGDASIGSQYISRFLEIHGNGAFNVNYDPNQAVPRRVWGLVE
jgi:hypothetical protein